MDHDTAMEMVDRLNFERHRDKNSLRWLRDEIEKLDFFAEHQIDELFEDYIK